MTSDQRNPPANPGPRLPTAPRHLPGRRHLLKGAALAAVPYALLPTPRAGALAPAPDYAPAEWQPAHDSNYTPADRPTDHPVDLIVIHVAQTTYANTLSVFQRPSKDVSAHYVVRSRDGHVAQCVRESDIGWHAGNWDYNTRSIGIEHEGWIDEPEYFTDVMYESSARLTAAICTKHAIPRDRAHIIAHHEIPSTDHTDPGPLWDWGRFLRLVESA
ncbi:N-acetylmuramoyl-L-alanine amidase [Streptomyces sp. NPDC059477]|uniref:N-acetylmuramoyl-L-alanine amidase n=1 Tax=Streptomyces sp. NPDC059477 TaxID=3346847 RepID=UPI0036883820